MEARPLGHHNQEIIQDIDSHMADIIQFPSRSHVEEQTWLDMQTDWEYGLFGDTTFEELQIKYYDWFRWERGYPPNGS